MKMIQSFDPSAAASGSFKHQIANACGGVYLFNESNQWLQLTLPDGGNVGLPAWWARFYHLQNVQGPVLWQVLDTIATIASPLSKVYGESYERNEIVGRGFYDGPIPRNPYIANSVSSTVSTNQVVNDGNPAITNVIEATQQGNVGGSNVSINNDGSFTFAQWQGGVYDNLLQLLPSASSPLLRLGAGLILEAVDQSGLNLSNIFGIDGSGNTFLQNHKTNNQTVIYDKNGVAILTLDANKCAKIAGVSQSVNGDTSGSMTVTEMLYGAFKVMMVSHNNYRQNAASAQTIILKNTFSGPFLIVAMGNATLQIQNGASVQSGNYLNAMTATGSAFLAETTIGQCVIGWNNTAIDRLVCPGSIASAHTGIVLFMGF